MLFARLATEVEDYGSTPGARMAFPQGRKPERAVFAPVAVIADADAGAVHQLDDRREHALLAQ